MPLSKSSSFLCSPKGLCQRKLEGRLSLRFWHQDILRGVPLRPPEHRTGPQKETGSCKEKLLPPNLATALLSGHKEWLHLPADPGLWPLSWIHLCCPRLMFSHSGSSNGCSFGLNHLHFEMLMRERERRERLLVHWPTELSQAWVTFFLYPRPLFQKKKHFKTRSCLACICHLGCLCCGTDKGKKGAFCPVSSATRTRDWPPADTGASWTEYGWAAMPPSYLLSHLLQLLFTRPAFRFCTGLSWVLAALLLVLIWEHQLASLSLPLPLYQSCVIILLLECSVVSGTLCT